MASKVYPKLYRTTIDEEPFAAMQRHPLQQQATKLLMEFLRSGEDAAMSRSANIDTLLRNAMEMTGGLAQVLPLPPTYEMDESNAGLSLVQLKRRCGAAFVRGTLFLLRSDRWSRRRVSPFHRRGRRNFESDYRPAAIGP